MQARNAILQRSGAWRYLEQQNVATVMGSAFGAEGYMRISYATSMSNLEGGLERIAAFIASAN